MKCFQACLSMGVLAPAYEQHKLQCLVSLSISITNVHVGNFPAKLSFLARMQDLYCLFKPSICCMRNKK